MQHGWGAPVKREIPPRALVLRYVERLDGAPRKWEIPPLPLILHLDHAERGARVKRQESPLAATHFCL